MVASHYSNQGKDSATVAKKTTVLKVKRCWKKGIEFIAVAFLALGFELKSIYGKMFELFLEVFWDSFPVDDSFQTPYLPSILPVLVGVGSHAGILQ